MKILITTLNSKYIHSNLAIKYLYSTAAPEIPGLEIAEYTINNTETYVFGEILKGDYDVVAFSCYIWNIEQTMYLAHNLKKAKPELTVILGGPQVSYDAVETIRENRFVDFVIQGEGEYSFKELCKVLTEAEHEKIALEEALPAIKGLVYRLNGKIYINEQAGHLMMDTVANPYLYITPESDKILYYESSRGCPRRCSYCLSSVEGNVRALSMDRAKSDLSYFILKRVKQVKFIDRTFNYDKKRAYEILKYLIETDNGVTNFHFEICADLLNEETLSLLATARKGLFQFEIGVQSTNRDALAAVDRSTDIKAILTNIQKVISLGNIEVHADLIAGLPFEDYASFGVSFNNVYRTNPHKLHLGFLKLLKGTKIREEASLHEYVYREKAPYEVIRNKYISAKDLAKLHQIEEILDLYYNRGGFEKTLEYMAAVMANSPFEFYEELADFYYFKGFQHSSHRKEDLYRILYAYAQWKDHSKPGCAERSKDILTQDMKNSMNFDAIKKFERKGWDL